MAMHDKTPRLAELRAILIKYEDAIAATWDSRQHAELYESVRKIKIEIAELKRA
ncbi:MAG TPA: hypothetical protein VGL89_15760 [Candidatus Koribacter sp.]|jgi:hypothetical protein